MDYHHYREALAETLAQSEVPFPAGEYQARLDKVRHAMTQQAFDALLLTDPADINYAAARPVAQDACAWRRLDLLLFARFLQRS